MYSKAFRALMIQKMTDPERPSQVSLADDFGVSRSSLYRCVSEADTLDIVANAEQPSFTESLQRLSNMKRPQDWSAEEKLAFKSRVLRVAGLAGCRPGLGMRVFR